MELRPIPAQVEHITCESSSTAVAQALRDIADAVEEHDLVLVGLWSTGFGSPSEATIQVVFDADGYPQVDDG